MSVGCVVHGSGTDLYGKYLERGDIVTILGFVHEEQWSSTCFYVLLPGGAVTSLTWSGGELEEHLSYLKRRIAALNDDDFSISSV